MNIMDIDTAQQKDLKYEYSLDGGDKEIIAMEARFLIIPTETHAIIIQGQIDVEHKEIKFSIPALNDLLRFPPADGKRIMFKFEMICNGSEVITPATGYMQVTNKIKVNVGEAKILEKTTIPIKLPEIEIPEKSKFAKNFEIYVKEKSEQ